MTTIQEERAEARADAAAEKARRKALRPWYRKKRFMLPLLLLAIVVIATATGGGEEPKKVGTTSDTGAASAPASPTENATPGEAAPKNDAPNASTFRVGDIVEKDNFQAAVLSVNPNYIPTNEFERPDAGMRFVAVEFQVTNTADESEHVSSLLQFKLRDASNAQHDISLMGAPDPRFPEGEVAAGDTVRGWVPFEVPADASGLRFVFDSSVFGSGRITWDLGA